MKTSTDYLKDAYEASAAAYSDWIENDRASEVLKKVEKARLALQRAEVLLRKHPDV